MIASARTLDKVHSSHLLDLIEHQDYKCALSGLELTPDTASVDHVVPVGRGGSHAKENLQVLHREINRMKGMLTNEEFVGYCRMVAARGMMF